MNLGAESEDRKKDSDAAELGDVFEHGADGGGEVFENEEDTENVSFTEPLNKEDYVGDHNNPIYAQLDFKKRKKLKSLRRLEDRENVILFFSQFRRCHLQQLVIQYQ